MGETLLRTFIAVPVPQKILSLQSRLKLSLSDQPGKIKWVRSNQLHLTLKFLGHTPPDSIDEIQTHIKEIVHSISPIQLTVEGTGCFPKVERPRVLWLGIKGELDPLKNLVQTLHEKMVPLGFLQEEKDFIPHLTLARIKYPQKNTPDIGAFLSSDYESIPLTVNKLQFISSELFPNGPVYTILGTHYFNQISS